MTADPKTAARDEFFIGWTGRLPRQDRRAFLATAGGLVLATMGLGFGLAAFQRPPGRGTWDPAAIQDFSGYLVRHPYPHLRTRAIDGVARSVLLMGEVKCGIAPRAASIADGPAVVRGSVLGNGREFAIAVVDEEVGLRPAADVALDALAPSAPVMLGPATLAGEILDSKCWYGAMRPASGKTHKSCAALCIRGGIPPAFFVRDRAGRTRILILTSKDGGPAQADILPYVGDPIALEGTLTRVDDLIFLAADVGDFRRREPELR